MPSSTHPIRAAAVAVLLTGAALIASLLIGVLVLLPAIFLGMDVFSLPVIVAAFITGQLGFFGVGFWYARRYNLRVHILIPTQQALVYTLGSVIIALIIAPGAGFILQELGVLPESVIEDVATTNPLFLLILAGLSVILVAPVEEYLFRGVIQGRLRQAFGPVGAILGAGVLFGLVHFLNFIGSPTQILVGVLFITIIGTVFGTVYELTNNLTVPILGQAIYNVVIFLTAFETM